MSSGITIHIPVAPAKVTELYDIYWKFAALRQEAFFNRINGGSYPFSLDAVINQYKFTNVYRATDRVSQYLIKNVIYKDGLSNDPKEVLFRILIFKLFNKIETWEILTNEMGVITYEDYTFELYDKILNNAITSKRRIYSAAYIMPSGMSYYGHIRKHSNHLKLIEHIIKSNTHDKLMHTKKMQQAFEIIKSFPSLGNFLAYQLLIDINYSTVINYSESEFVVPGPGARGGISKCFHSIGGLNEVEIIKLMTENQEKEFNRLELTFQTLWGRPLQLIDCQNIFCEVDKYTRVTHPHIKGSSDRVRIKQVYKMNPNPIEYSFPPKWDLNQSLFHQLLIS